MSENNKPYKILIGLETHVQLLTKTKLFCGCSTKFGSPPNANVCSGCLAMPGTLPVLNKKAYELALKTVLALHCTVSRFMRWDRKHYFYPDLPGGYQISQFDLPIGLHGRLAISDMNGTFEPKEIRIMRAHMEADAGKSLHDEKSRTGDTRIDLNRGGMPLLEIVTQPDMASSDEAFAYLTELKLLLRHIGASDCNMQEGSLRCDANVNLHIFPTPENGLTEIYKTPIVEVKNLNSFRAVKRAIEFETQRQYQTFLDALESGGKAGVREEIAAHLSGSTKETWLWDENAQVTRPMRAKELASDYRYYPETDLPPVVTSEETIESAKQSLGELPAAIRARYQAEMGLSPYDSDVIVNQGPPFIAYFEEVAQETGEPKQTANWVQQDVLRLLNEKGVTIEEFPIPPKNLAEMILAMNQGKLPKTRGKDVFTKMFESRQTVEQAMEQLGIATVDGSEIEELCKKLLAENPNVSKDVQSGNVKAVGMLIGKAKKINPNINPTVFQETCLKIIQDFQ